MITYTTLFDTVKVPVLHKISYARQEDTFSTDNWCKDNCKGAYYHSPRWNDTYIEFEDDEDATWFALVWS